MTGVLEQTAQEGIERLQRHLPALQRTDDAPTGGP
jgi:hypothetical protein